MNKNIHPPYNSIQATCSCGNIINIKSTIKKDIFLDVCSSCHPFYTGQRKIMDTRGRVEKFSKKFNRIGF
ncbi:50S ribosomal protein L31 [Candidatus Purcelliella pentastirinorum]|uniref:Large ribosomal subunit protein bL31 n=1 Tax=Candidatus Purcelliella pentastirinorum TaxID=472834 RepID=A0AAX3N781_9ENTR|nr:50S ribosomal protein L31 [Candidatus Purcelliella pentastirinorum]WDI78447.1 50S ribosomal protein L31 [Candidatus Purcelliella pentastirinorum]WDR80524.1 50S ribosomal protein L31 [Candidatus Purcelliella pentastirinorum]